MCDGHDRAEADAQAVVWAVALLTWFWARAVLYGELPSPLALSLGFSSCLALWILSARRPQLRQACEQVCCRVWPLWAMLATLLLVATLIASSPDRPVRK
jgi:hypothetical protein